MKVKDCFDKNIKYYVIRDNKGSPIFDLDYKNFFNEEYNNFLNFTVIKSKIDDDWHVDGDTLVLYIDLDENVYLRKPIDDEILKILEKQCENLIIAINKYSKDENSKSLYESFMNEIDRVMDLFEIIITNKRR